MTDYKKQELIKILRELIISNEKTQQLIDKVKEQLWLQWYA